VTEPSQPSETTVSSAVKTATTSVNDPDDMTLSPSPSSESEAPDCPTRWTLDQKNDYPSKYDWLYVCKQKLGCSSCQKVGSLGVESNIGMKIVKARTDGNITFFGESRQQQLTSLRKEIFDHKDTASHRAAVKLGILDSLLNCLLSYGMTEEHLKTKLVCVACDGAAVMLGHKTGLKKLLTDKFPSVIFWHCANHRLELTVGDTIKEVSGINRFKAFLDKLYVLYHASPKNSRELQECAKLLDVQLLKIGRVLSSRWVASSFRSVSAVWENYDALVEHFQQAKQCPSRDQKDRYTYDGLLRKITSTEFVLDLALMCDALQELAGLSLDLQDRKLDLYVANQKIKTVVQVFKERQTKLVL